MSDADTPIANPETLWIVEVTAPLPTARVQIVVAEASARLKLPPEKLTALLDNRIGPVTKPLPRASAERVAEVLDVAGVEVQLKPNSVDAAPQVAPQAEAKPAQAEAPVPQPSTAVSREPATPSPIPTSTGDRPEETTSSVEAGASPEQVSEEASPESPDVDATTVSAPSAPTWKPPLLPTKAEKDSQLDARETAASAAAEPAAQQDRSAERIPEAHELAGSSVTEATVDGSSEHPDTDDEVVSDLDAPAAVSATSSAASAPRAVSTGPQRFASPNEPEAVDVEAGQDDSASPAQSVSGEIVAPTSMNPPFEPDEPIEATQASDPSSVAGVETKSVGDEQGDREQPAASVVDASVTDKDAPLLASQNLEQFEVPNRGAAEARERDTEVSEHDPPTASTPGKQDPWARLAQEGDVEDLGQWNAPNKPEPGTPAPMPRVTKEAASPVPDPSAAVAGSEAARASGQPMDSAPASSSASTGPASTPPAAEPHPMFSTDELGALDDEEFEANEETFFSGGMRDPFKEAEERERAIRRGILLTALVIATGVLIYLQRGLI